MNRNVVLIGFMGVGKTTYGKKIAKILGMKFIDTDKHIEKMEKLSVAKIFEKKGEDYFRAKEAEVSKCLSKKQGYVIATGGGLIKNKENVLLLKETGVILYLETTPEMIFANLANDNSRPLLEGEDKLGKIRELLSQRRGMYEETSQLRIDLSKSGIRANIGKILTALEEYL